MTTTMSKMTTSSSHMRPNVRVQRRPPSDDTCREQNQSSSKVLTNFSIDSIIGHANIVGAHSVRVEHPSTGIKLEINATRSTLKQVEPRHAHPAGNQNNHRATAHDGTRPFQEVKKYRPKNFQCPVCSMAFSNNGQLKNHVRIHTGERPFKCNQPACGKTFTRNEELTRHKLIHTGFRPHACTSCSKRFGRKDHLKKHVRTHERKEMRKGCYVARNVSVLTRSVKSECAAIQPMAFSSQTLFSPKKSDNKEEPVCTLRPHLDVTSIDERIMIPNGGQSSQPYNQYASSISLLAAQPPLPPPVTFAQVPQEIDQFAAQTMATIASSTASLGILSNTTSDPLQQLAGDYWQKWYQFLGFYQQT